MFSVIFPILVSFLLVPLTIPGGSIVVPGTGTIVRAVETCSERKALVLGKPHAYVRKFLESCGLDPARTLMIGDRYLLFDRL